MSSTLEHQPQGVHLYARRGKPGELHPYLKHRHITQAATRAADGANPWNLPTLCAAYNWPTGLAGGGVIAIVELGGGWLPTDLNQFCAANNVPVPAITDVSVGGAVNNPGQNSDADGEVALDIQVAAAAYAIATGQAATIRMYWANDIAAAIRAATTDGCDVCSISWGSDENQWGLNAANDLQAAALAATNAGMIVFAAAGDNNSSDGGPGAANVDLPAGAPNVIGCGGTRKTPTAETVWNHNSGKSDGQGTGGGYSTFFTRPAWQINTPPDTRPDRKLADGRMIPDVAANADPDTGYNVVVAGVSQAIGGTSAVAPLYAGLFAAFGTKRGFVTPTLYQNPAAFTDITVGNNGAYQAAIGPDPCTGLGVPNGAALAALFAAPVVTS